MRCVASVKLRTSKSAKKSAGQTMPSGTKIRHFDLLSPKININHIPSQSVPLCKGPFRVQSVQYTRLGLPVVYLPSHVALRATTVVFVNACPCEMLETVL